MTPFCFLGPSHAFWQPFLVWQPVLLSSLPKAVLPPEGFSVFLNLSFLLR